MENKKKAANEMMMVTLSFKIPLALHQKLNEHVVLDGYGLRGKSKWVKEAIINLLSFDDYPELVNLSDEMKGNSKVISVRIPRALMLQIEKCVLHIREAYPGLEGVKSKIVRTAILQRIIRGING